MSGDGSEDPHFIKDAGGAPAAGAYLSCACADATKIPSAQTFVSAYRAAYGTPPEIYSGEAFDATNFVLAAIKSGATTPSAINSYLATNSYPGVTKTVKFQPTETSAAARSTCTRSRAVRSCRSAPPASRVARLPTRRAGAAAGSLRPQRSRAPTAWIGGEWPGEPS